LGHEVPPQSTAVSVPFFVASEHVAATQVVPLHTPLAGSAQSAAFVHFFPGGQPAQVPPPQSISVSVPFRVLSLQPAPWQTLAVQTPLEQSVPVVQPPPLPHFGQEAPPQSVPVSVPFFTVSLHVAATHAPAVHLPLAGSTQSMLPEQPLPTAHLVLHVPPQSMSVSVPFSTRSVHVAAVHTFAVHLPLVGVTQSVFALHAPPTAQVGHVPPPQSAAVSAPFMIVSVHVAAAHLPLTQ
jgi:hypothetical protein